MQYSFSCSLNCYKEYGAIKNDIYWYIILMENNPLSNEDEESGKRIVRSAKEKRYEEMLGHVKKIKNFKKNNDMSNILECKLIFSLYFLIELNIQILYNLLFM
jgi:hypothetical protein